MADYVTLKRRPLLMVGTWNASTGTEGITDDDLAEIVRAAESGVLDNAVIKRGHTDPRFQTRLEDGTPAFGSITNLTIEDGVLYGDYVNVPADLADTLDSAYPHSSVELARNVVIRDQEGNVKHEFGCVLTANALLGATAPAVKGLSTKMSDVATLSSGVPTYVEIRQSQFSAVRAALPGGNTASSLAEKLAALVDDRFSSETNWGYLEDFDDEVVYAAVSDGSKPVIYRQTYEIKDNGTPELVGDPVQVVKETKWVAEGEKVAASEGENDDDTPDVHPQTPETAQSEGGETPNPSPETQGETPMATVDKKQAAELRKQYGLKSTSTTEELLAAVIADKQEKKHIPPGSDETPNPEVRDQQRDEFYENTGKYLSEGTGETDPDEDGEDDDDTVTRASTTVGDGQGEPATAVAKHNSHGKKATVNGEEKFAAPGTDGAVKVSASLFSEMQSRLSATEARLAARELAETKSRRDGLVRGWYQKGLISDDEATRVRARLDRDEELTIELIEERVPAFFSDEIGHAEPSIFAAAEDNTKSEFEQDDATFGFKK